MEWNAKKNEKIDFRTGRFPLGPKHKTDPPPPRVQFSLHTIKDLNDPQSKISRKTHINKLKKHMGELTHNMGEEAHNMGEQAHNMGEQAHNMGEQAHNMGEQAHNMGEQAHIMGEQAHITGEHTQLLWGIPKNHKKNKKGGAYVEK